jgi:hypothetical protein
MRKAFLVLAAALAVPAAAVAATTVPSPQVLCGISCGGPGGMTGCADLRTQHSASVTVVASITHFLVVHYCKRNGIITSVAIAAHGCDTQGLVACSTGPAWQTGGGVGATWATFEAHASWHITPLGMYNGTDVLTLTVPTG